MTAHRSHPQDVRLAGPAASHLRRMPGPLTAGDTGATAALPFASRLCLALAVVLILVAAVTVSVMPGRDAEGVALSALSPDVTQQVLPPVRAVN